MAAPSPDTVLKRAHALLGSPTLQSYRAQAHARSVLRSVARDPEGWPNFSPQLDERLHHAAHSLLWSAMELMEAGHPQTEINPLLLAGSESLEFLCAHPSAPSSVRLEQAVTATFGYYLGGYYARSYVLLREAVPDETELPPILALLVAVLRKRFDAARRITFTHFANPHLNDAIIAGQLERGELSHDEAYERVLLVSATQAVSAFLEYPKCGDRLLLDTAIQILDDAVLIARERRCVDWWWWLYCLRFLFHEIGRASPWEKLSPLKSGDGWFMVDEYIRAGLRVNPPIVELWPSQVHAIPTVLAADRKDFCLKMPTSAGKTRIAELAILRFLIDHTTDGTAKCLYLAPFRSLAVEVEQTLRKSLGTQGVQVSQLYGGFEVTPADAVFLNQFRVLVATPEKVDALLRFVPELASQIRLVIIDEGHIIDTSSRGLRFEVFVHRLTRRLRGPNCRFVFVSAVLPNARQFAEWITGSADNLVESAWRPSRLLLGRLSWRASRTRIDYTHQERKPFGHDCYVPKFIEQQPCRGVPGLGKRRNPFPADAGEAFALSALLFAREGMTLYFVPQQKQAEPTARQLHQALCIHRALLRQSGSEFSLPLRGADTPAWRRCRSTILSEMGEDSLLLTLIDEGIVFHHGDLPVRARLAVEELARTEAVRLIVATSTLAQGINLPIKTVIVRGLQIDQTRRVSPMTFWNICGRAGRGMKENEGQVLFCVDQDKTPAQLRGLNRTITQVIDTLEQATVVSGVLSLLRQLVSEWQYGRPDVDFGELCQQLAEDKFDWVRAEQLPTLRRAVDTLDGHLIALSEEFQLDPTSPDRLQELIQGSLLAIQLRDSADSSVTFDVTRDILHARVRMIHRAHPDRAVRNRLYLLGMSLSSCQSIESNKLTLFELFREAEGWAEWPTPDRVRLLLRISEFIFSVTDTTPAEPVPAEWPAILTRWLSGDSTSAIVLDPAVATYTKSPSQLSVLLEELCGYLLPWGLNSILVLLKGIEEEVGAKVPTVCSYFSGMVKYGLANAVAVCLLPYLDNDRRLALEAAPLCPGGVDRPDEIARWILRVSVQELMDAGLNEFTAKSIASVRDRDGLRSPTGATRQSTQFEVRCAPDATVETAVGQKVLVQVNDAVNVKCLVYTLDGRVLGQFDAEFLGEDRWWADAHAVDAEVHEIEADSTGTKTVTLTVLGV